jgi:ribosomal protein S18 acetylase RimI-like enzyme
LKASDAIREKSFRIFPAKTVADVDATASLFRAYAASLPIDLAYQGFEAELAALPGKYAPPSGALLLARRADGEAIGCVALRANEPEGCCEMKRLYVSPEGRGLGLGRALVTAILAEAARIGYREIRLDTLGTMTGALALYQKAGFEPVPPYYDTPIAGTIFFAKRLSPLQ